MIRQTSNNLRQPERGEECPTLLALRLKEAFERAKAKREKTDA